MNYKKISIQDLLIEVGRNCNMRCEHCLRGEPENLEIDFQNVKALLDQVESIGSITFTGGEPFLYPQKIIQIIDYIMDQKISCDGFYIATNGSVFNMELMEKLCEFYLYIDPMGDFQCRVDVSRDVFHQEQTPEPQKLFSLFTFAGVRGETTNPDYMILEGRAAENGIGGKGRALDYSMEFSLDSDCVEMVYLNALGQVLPDCDYSYDSQRNMEPMSIREHSLEEIVLTYHHEEEVLDIAV